MDKIIDIEERIPSLKERRKRRANRKFSIIIVLFAIALLIVLYLQSSLSRIDHIHITGATLHDEVFYEHTSGLLRGEIIWSFSTNKVKEKIEAVAEVKNVEVKRKWLRDVEIVVTEWQTLAYVENEGTYKVLLENGNIFSEEFSIVESKAPILTNFEDDHIRESLTKQLTKTNDDVYTLISEIIYTGTEENPTTITVYMDDGYEVHAVISTFSEKMVYYSDIISQLDEYEKGVIDLEVGTYFTPYSALYGNSKSEEGEVSEESTE